MKATVKYIGRSEYGKEDRFAEIVTPAKNEEKVRSILHESGWKYECYGDSEESIFTVKIDDKDDYMDFMTYWKQAKKAI